MPVLNTIVSSVVQNEFSHTCCIVLYSTFTYDIVQVPQAVKLEGPVAPCTRCERIRQYTCQSTIALSRVWYTWNFINLLYCSMQHPDIISHTSATRYIRILKLPVAALAVGVRSGGHRVRSCANELFVHPLYGFIQHPDIRRCTGSISCTHKLGGAVAPRIVGVPFRQRACHFSRPWGPVLQQRNFLTLDVWFYTAP